MGKVPSVLNGAELGWDPDGNGAWRRGTTLHAVRCRFLLCRPCGCQFSHLDRCSSVDKCLDMHSPVRTAVAQRAPPREPNGLG